MISLVVWGPMLVLFLLATAWVLAWAARSAGSPRGWFSVGLLVALVIFIVNLVCLAAQRIAPATNPVAMTLVLLVAQLGVAFAVMRAAFALPPRRTWAPWGAWIGIVIAQAMLVVLIVRPLVGEAFLMPTRSMSPTIEAGDRFMVDKLLRPRRLDLVAYHSHSDPGRPIYCKRLIALPGERLRFEHGGIFIDDRPVDLPPVLAGRCHARYLGSPMGRYYDAETITLGADEYFVIGDNVYISADSRIEGPTKKSELVGVIDLVYWPPKKARVIR